jgi:hypothetical protein
VTILHLLGNYGGGEMNSSRELGIGVLTVSVAAVACGIADYGEGVAFGVLIGAGGCLTAMSAYGLFRLFSRLRAPASRDRPSGRISR